MHHRQDIRLTGAAAHRALGQVDAVRPALDGGQILGDAETCRVVGMEPEDGVGRHHLAGHLQGLIDFSRIGGAGGILEADGMKGDLRIEDLSEAIHIEFRGMGARYSRAADPSWSRRSGG